MGTILIGFGAFLMLLGALLLLLEKFGVPRLPGDILIQKGNFTFYFPLVTMLLVSLVLTIVVNFFRK